MAESIWKDFMASISGEEKLLPLSTYEVECTGARPHRKEGEIQRGIFVDYVVTKGPEKNASASIYIKIPDHGNRSQGFWYAKKMAGFGNLDQVYAAMPDDLEAALEILCAALVGRKMFAVLGPGSGDYSNRNALTETKPLGDTAPVAPKEDTDKDEAGDDWDPGF